MARGSKGGKVLKFDASGPSLNKGEILRVCEQENVRFMRLQFTDILGIIKNVEIPSSSFRRLSTARSSSTDRRSKDSRGSKSRT